MKKMLPLFLLFWSFYANAHNYTREEILNNPDAPEFAKLSVQSNVNYFEVLRAFKAYEKAHPKEELEKVINQRGEKEEEEETDEWRFYFKRWNSKVLGLVQADGSIIDLRNDSAIQQRINIKQNMLRQESATTGAKPTGLGWRLVGPNTHINTNGDTADQASNIYCVHFNTTDPSIGFCGSETGYIFKTTDAGESWTLSSTGMIFYSGVRSVTTNPTNANIVYAGDGNSIYKSIDGGLTWNTIYSGVGVVWSILVNPLQPQTLLAATENGVYQSYNGGTNFVLRHSGKITSIEYKPGDTTVVYAFTTRQVATASFPSGNYNSNFYKSNNGGQSFTIKTNGWFSYNSSRRYRYMTGDITVSADNPNIIYALLAGEEIEPSNPANNRKGEIGILKSMDAGENWAFVKGPYVTPNLMCFPWQSSSFNNVYWQGDYNNWIIANPANSNEVIVGGLSGYKSTNGGINWTNLLGYSSLYSTHPDHQNFFMSGSTLWIANDGGLLKSGDFLTTAPLVKINGLCASEFWGLGVGWNQEIVTGGRYHNGNASYYAGVNPLKTFIALGGGESATGYVSPYEPKLYHSDIDGYRLMPAFPNVQYISNLMQYPNESYGLTDFSNLIYHPNRVNTLYMGKGTSFWKSSDGGNSFVSQHAFTHNVADFDIPLSAPDTIMLTTITDDKIWRSTNGGTTFVDITGSLPGGGKKLCMNPLNAKECWVLICGSGNVYRTTNLGTTWTNEGGGNMSGEAGYDILLQGSDTDPTCYVACNNGGVFYKNNSTAGNWTILDLNLPAAHLVRRLEPFYARNKFFFGTSGIGIWEHDLMNPVQPFANFASNRQLVECSKDTLLFYDHSIVDESVANATRTWSFPGATYVNTSDPKQPRVLYTIPGNYNVTLTITDANNSSHTRTLSNFITFNSVDRCKVDTLPGLALTTNSTGTHRVDISKADINGNSFTISTWVKPNGNQVSFSQILGTQAPNTNFGIGFAFNGYTPNLNLVFTHSAIGYWETSTINLDSDTWNYITLVYTPTGVTIYKNGQAPGWAYTSGTFGNVDFNSGSMYINPDIHGQGGNFKGEIDEIAFYNTALTLPQIREQMHLTKNTTTANLAKYIQFNQYTPSESIMYDAIGSGSAAIPVSNIIPSNAPVASGSVHTINSVNAAGTYTFDSTGLSITLPPTGTYPNGTLVGFKLNTAPDVKPSTDSTFPNRTYWIINNYGSNASFSQLSSLKLSDLYKKPSYVYTNNEFKLYKRASTTFGNTWGGIQDVSDLVTVNPNSIDITFSSANNITSFSQLVITANNPDVLLPIKGVNEPITAGVFNAYPNPAEDWVTFTFSSSKETTGTISMYDVTGRLVRQLNAISLKTGNNNILCNISDLSHGIYETSLTLANWQTYHIKISKRD